MRILIIDDEVAISKIVTKFLEQAQHEVFSAATALEGLEKNGILKPDLILLDLHLPDMDGIQILSKLNEAVSPPSVVVITGEGSVDTAVTAMKMGAEDYLEKPIDMEKLKLVARKIEVKRGLQREVATLRQSQMEMYRKDYLFLSDPEMQKLYAEVEQVAQQDKVTVMILGETGTGKEHVARLIHALSPRAARPFVELHCGSLPESILESELFGYEPGAFTDAKRQKQGLFEEAQTGTVFLDEIGELTPSVQMKLLKVLEQKSIRRLGGNREIPLDVRIVTATHRDLEKEVKEGRFRADLYYRLNVIPLSIPALRQRPDDIAQLAHFFFKESCRAFNKKLSLLSDDVLAALKNYSWPGNVRELKHVIERLVVTSKSASLSVRDLPKEIREMKALPPETGKRVLSRDQSELENIKRALIETKGNKSNAAKLLGITRKTLFNKIQKYGLKAD
ncbi:MAG TPA: sigma-54 dependent transcriptional regulator [bacterium]|nr:sigma-54 dependent transcriptional regulator [bacterium]